MAASNEALIPKISLEIRTKSVEQTLVPLIAQITTLVNHKEKPIKSEKTLQALAQVGHAVNVAVQRFVDIGESIAEENGDIRRDMSEACQEARVAGASIQRLTRINTGIESTAGRKLAEKTEMVQVARQLLSAVTKVLLLADRVVVKQLLVAKTKVLNDTHKLESVSSFGDFVQAFSQFGNHMVEFAHITGDRQNDLKCEKNRARIAAARTVLERSTMMLLMSSKTAMRHPDCDAALSNRAGVLALIRQALQAIHNVVTDGQIMSSTSMSPAVAANGDLPVSQPTNQPLFCRSAKEFQDTVEMVRMTKLASGPDTKLQNCLDSLLEATLEFTDSAYTSHANRENILVLGDKLRSELTSLVHLGQRTQDQKPLLSAAAETEVAARLETTISRVVEALAALKKELLTTAMNQASELFKSAEEGDLVASLRQCAASGAAEKVRELSIKLDEHSEHIQELCRLMAHVAASDVLVAWTQHVESTIKSLSAMLLQSTLTLAMNPGSKVAKENMDVFAEAWAQQMSELSTLVRDVSDNFHGNKTDKQLYLSLPKPGKHGTTVKGIKPVKLSSEEQSKIAKLGLEMKLITSEMEADVERWEDWDNELVRRARNMSSMAFSMYLFTRGEGQLRTTQDLFTQAEYFADEGTKLFRAIKEFAVLVPAGTACQELLVELERLPAFCHELNYALRTTTVGKAATFNKVDSVIHETKNLMNAVSKVVNTCFLIFKRYNVDYTGRPVRVPRMPLDGFVGGAGSDGSDLESIKSGRSDKHAVRNVPYSTARETTAASSFDCL